MIGNKTADDANIMLDVQAACQKEPDEDDTRAGFFNLLFTLIFKITFL